jgi:hypothetical protein
MENNVLITGGTGLIGLEIASKLSQEGYNVALLTRNKRALPYKQFLWNIETNFIAPEAISFANIIIHLAGENIASKRWTKKQKERIISSRVKSTNLLYNTIKNAKNKPHTLISASAVGYYGNNTKDNLVTEENPSGNDFLAQTVAAWEAAVLKFEKLNIRTVIFRLGVVFSSKGGALQKIKTPLKFKISAPIGSGNQYISWISLDDFSRLVLFTIKNTTINGIYNAVNPEFITNKALMKRLAKKHHALYVPIGFPSWLLHLVLGEMASVVTTGNKASAKKITQAGFTYKDTIEAVI